MAFSVLIGWREQGYQNIFFFSLLLHEETHTHNLELYFKRKKKDRREECVAFFLRNDVKLLYLGGCKGWELESQTRHCCCGHFNSFRQHDFNLQYMFFMSSESLNTNNAGRGCELPVVGISWKNVLTVQSYWGRNESGSQFPSSHFTRGIQKHEKNERSIRLCVSPCDAIAHNIAAMI